MRCGTIPKCSGLGSWPAIGNCSMAEFCFAPPSTRSLLLLCLGSVSQCMVMLQLGYHILEPKLNRKTDAMPASWNDSTGQNTKTFHRKRIYSTLGTNEYRQRWWVFNKRMRRPAPDQRGDAPPPPRHPAAAPAAHAAAAALRQHPLHHGGEVVQLRAAPRRRRHHRHRAPRVGGRVGEQLPARAGVAGGEEGGLGRVAGDGRVVLLRRDDPRGRPRLPRSMFNTTLNNRVV